MKIFGINFSKLISTSTSESDDIVLSKFKKVDKEKGMKNFDINKKLVEVNSKDLDEWEIIEEMDYSDTSKKDALLPLLNGVLKKYQKNAEPYTTVSEFFGTYINAKNRPSFTEMKKDLTARLEKTCDEETVKAVVQEFERLVKEGDKE
ncbi:MAG: hypothetical protein CO175_05955 [Verrucomicrobia bacterium CG_4_9_14_3_um_filter_43_20]|nr:MAG: hypothetical protein AUJ82_02335 [Verrucomicrobia bacterium CG1_02_43_26]PIP58854.1 MAG: hypothetical protein COX01_06700 [Verrucomicrobia bacterium CG22_combo_CG10-13_8_21_14_all_43_17]PIY62052.1 MAG: hypothetical protein COY94_03075 [Verrucomicrobia bacterium CG_4_10_14_0_8_um_filter_43_34]PJA43845.1 MAG: hypothetical protein CO175_05955 [Verrucomicrobia bacterium CG_4_9_14_3_um_filter_43_20]